MKVTPWYSLQDLRW